MTTPNNTTTNNINVDLLDIPTPEVLINTIKNYTPQQIAELINKQFISELKQGLRRCANNYKITNITIDINKYCDGYTHSCIVDICRQLVGKYRSNGYIIDARVTDFADDGIRTSFEFHIKSIEVPNTTEQKINISPPPYEEITNKPTPVKEAYI